MSDKMRQGEMEVDVRDMQKTICVVYPMQVRGEIAQIEAPKEGKKRKSSRTRWTRPMGKSMEQEEAGGVG